MKSYKHLARHVTRDHALSIYKISEPLSRSAACLSVYFAERKKQGETIVHRFEARRLNFIAGESCGRTLEL